MSDQGTEPGQLDPDPHPTATSLTRAAGVAAWSNLREYPDIGAYRILGVLGEGGMGTVYRAEQQNPQRIVALR